MPAIETWQITRLDIALAAPRKYSFDSHNMSAEIGREMTTYSQLATRNVSAIAPTETTHDWPNTVTLAVSNTAWSDGYNDFLTFSIYQKIPEIPVGL